MHRAARVFAQVGAFLRYNDQAHALAHGFVRDTQNHGVKNVGVGQRQLFNFVHGNLLAVAVNLVLRAAGHLKVLAGNQAHNVAGAVEAVLGEAVAVRVLLQVVAANRVRAAGEQVAALAALDRLVLIVNNQDFVVGANRVALGSQA